MAGSWHIPHGEKGRNIMEAFGDNQPFTTAPAMPKSDPWLSGGAGKKPIEPLPNLCPPLPTSPAEEKIRKLKIEKHFEV